MASAASNAARLTLLASRSAPRVSRLGQSHQIARQCIPQRALSTTRVRWADESKDAGRKRQQRAEYEPVELKNLDKSFTDSATPEGLRQLDELAKTNGFNTIDEFLTSSLQNREWVTQDRELAEELRRDDLGERPNKSSFWFDENDPENNTEEHDEWNEDDITSMAHSKLDEVRDMRQYARLAVWEMPLLSKLAKPFKPPTNDQVLRWRYTTYMGESHPAEKKVVVQFAPADLDLTHVQREKLKKLAGPRYNPETQFIKMSSESFEHQAQNKRYLEDLVGKLIASAKDPKDTFKDVPLDLRHHQFKCKPRFPREWRMTEERRRELDEHRQKVALSDIQRAEGGLLVDGQQTIDHHLIQQLAAEQEKEKQAELVAASPRSRGAGGNKARK